MGYIPSSVSVTSSLAVLARKSAIGACILTSQFLKAWDLGVAGGAWNDFFFCRCASTGGDHGTEGETKRVAFAVDLGTREREYFLVNGTGYRVSINRVERMPIMCITSTPYR